MNFPLNPHSSKRVTKLQRGIEELGFHKAWGQFIGNENKQHRIIVWTTRNKHRGIQMTKTANYYDMKNSFILLTTENVDVALEKIKQYFQS
jgi:hypothetical protein